VESGGDESGMWRGGSGMWVEIAVTVYGVHTINYSSWKMRLMYLKTIH